MCIRDRFQGAETQLKQNPQLWKELIGKMHTPTMLAVFDTLADYQLDIPAIVVKYQMCIRDRYGTEPDGYINYVKGANVAGFRKVAKAMICLLYTSPADWSKLRSHAQRPGTG